MSDDHTPLLPPDELFRQYQRGMLDQNTLITQILLNLIEQAEVQKVLMEMLGTNAEDMNNLSLDIEVIASHLQLPRPSQAGAMHDLTSDQNGTTGPDQAGENGSEAAPPLDPPDAPDAG